MKRDWYGMVQVGLTRLAHTTSILRNGYIAAHSSAHYGMNIYGETLCGHPTSATGIDEYQYFNYHDK